MDRQIQDTKDLTEYMYNRYDSPAAQRKAMEAAGINPFAAEGSSIQPGAASASGPDQPSGGTAPLPNQESPWSNIQPAFAQSANMMMDAYMKEAQIKKINAETLGVQLSNKAQENENSIFDLVRGEKYEQYLSAHFNRKLRQYDDQIKELRFQMEQGANQAEIFEKLSKVVDNLASAARTDADRIFIEETKDSVIELNKAKAKEANARARLSDAQTETENGMRKLNQALTRNQIVAAMHEAGIKEIEKMHNLSDLLDDLNGMYKTTSLFGLADKILSGTATQIMGAILPGTREEVRKKLIDALAKYAQ